LASPSAGLKKGIQVITYCQTGVRAAHSLFTLRLMGYDGGKNYDGSWQEWGNSKDTQIAQ
jgi:thiosulfate/3-mercaptopyruvate sulfurtransferase